MQAPNIDNLFLACVPKIYFDTGSGERELGLIEKPPDVEPKCTEIPVYNSQDGVCRLQKIFTTKEEINWSFVLQEAVAATMQAYFKGGPLEMVGAGTAAVMDQKAVLAGGLLASLGKYGLTAVTVRQFLDACLVFTGGAYVDNSIEADSLAGAPFSLLSDPADFVYFGKATKFQELYLDLAVDGDYTGPAWEYWDGSAWQSLTVAGAGASLDGNGKVNWTLPVDWATNIVNGSNPLYWVRVKCTGVTTPATCNCVRQNAAQNTDYILDPGQAGEPRLLGRVGRLAAGFLADGEEVKVSFTHTTWASLQFAMANGSYQQGAARIAFRPLDGFQWDFIFPLCQLKPNGKLTFDDGKPMEVPMTMVVLNGYAISPAAPYGYWKCLNES